MPLSSTAWHTVPKVELHVHLEGAIPHPVFARLVEKYAGPHAVNALPERLQYRDFPHFLETWAWKNGFLREVEDFTLVAEGAARAWAEQRILYVETFFSPGEFASKGLSALRIAEAVQRGFARVPEVRVALVADLVRDLGAERGARQLDELAEGRSLGIIGVGIGGSEHRFPPELFTEVFHRARELGFRCSAHAGEAAGPESVWGALRALRVERIGHGVRAIEDPRLVQELVRSGVHLEVCPLSNVRTGVVASLTEHPVARLVRAGVRLSVSTDDPMLFGNTLAGEYQALHEGLGLSVEEIHGLVVQAARDCWLPADDRARLVAAIAENPAWRALRRAA